MKNNEWIDTLELFVDTPLADVVPGDRILCSVCYHYPENNIWTVVSIKHTKGSNKWSLVTLASDGYNNTRVFLNGDSRVRCEHTNE